MTTNMTPAQRLAAERAKTIEAGNGRKARANNRRNTIECRLAQMTISLGLTLQDVSGGTGIAYSPVRAIATGQDPTLTQARQLASFFGCTIADIWPASTEAAIPDTGEKEESEAEAATTAATTTSSSPPASSPSTTQAPATSRRRS